MPVLKLWEETGDWWNFDQSVWLFLELSPNDEERLIVLMEEEPIWRETKLQHHSSKLQLRYSSGFSIFKKMNVNIF